MKRKILFLTGTRADFGKIKPLIRILETSDKFEPYIFVTGMHMLKKYGYTLIEVEKEKFRNIYTYINQTGAVPMEVILSSTIQGVSNYVHEFKPDMIVIHGDRVETLAGAIVGALNNILVAHIEGGEISGTIDELLRHSTSKLSHIHFVANERAKKRLVQMGERPENVFIIGSPDMDVMLSDKLPSIEQVKEHYEISFESYSIFIYHPVTTEINCLRRNIKEVAKTLVESGKQFVAIYPNNDAGSDIILEELQQLKHNANFRVIPSVRFEYFLTLLKNCEMIIGNSSCGIREAEVYGKAAINIGTRQENRYLGENIINVMEDKGQIINAINNHCNIVNPLPKSEFGDGKSAQRFFEILSGDSIWSIPVQKQFKDL